MSLPSQGVVQSPFGEDELTEHFLISKDLLSHERVNGTAMSPTVASRSSLLPWSGLAAAALPFTPSCGFCEVSGLTPATLLDLSRLHKHPLPHQDLL